MKKIKKLLKKQGFTLVELIIVIAIIAVLAVAAFMMLTKWLGKSRDSRRLGDLGTIARGLQVGYSDVDDGINMYPTVKDQTGAIALLSGADTIVGYQGVVDNEVVVGASMQKAPMDPSDGSYYTYLVSQNRQKFQLLGFLEDGTEVGILNDTFALEYKNMTPTTKGFDLGVVLRESDNMPANLIGGGLTGVDMTANTAYVAVVNGADIRTGTNIATAPIVKEEVIDQTEPVVVPYNYKTSCKELLLEDSSLDSGTYTIDIDGENGVDPIEVYCDMDTNDGGRTRINASLADSTVAFGADDIVSGNNYGQKCGTNVPNFIITNQKILDYNEVLMNLERTTTIVQCPAFFRSTTDADHIGTTLTFKYLDTSDNRIDYDSVCGWFDPWTQDSGYTNVSATGLPKIWQITYADLNMSDKSTYMFRSTCSQTYDTGIYYVQILVR